MTSARSSGLSSTRRIFKAPLIMILSFRSATTTNRLSPGCVRSHSSTSNPVLRGIFKSNNISTGGSVGNHFPDRGPLLAQVINHLLAVAADLNRVHRHYSIISSILCVRHFSAGKQARQVGDDLIDNEQNTYLPLSDRLLRGADQSASPQDAQDAKVQPGEKVRAQCAGGRRHNAAFSDFQITGRTCQ